MSEAIVKAAHLMAERYNTLAVSEEGVQRMIYSEISDAFRDFAASVEEETKKPTYD